MPKKNDKDFKSEMGTRASLDSPYSYYYRRYYDLEEILHRKLDEYKSLAANFSVDKGRFNIGDKDNYRKTNILLDPTPINCINTLKNGLKNGIANRSLDWFNVGLENRHLQRSEGVGEWLDIVKEFSMDIFNDSNFYRQLDKFYYEIALFGTAAMEAVQDDENFMRFRTFNTGEYVLGVNSEGRVDTFGRRWELTSRQMVERFGLENVSENVRGVYQETGGEDTIFVLKQIIEPVKYRDYEDSNYEYLKVKNKDMKYRSVIWEEGRGGDTGFGTFGNEKTLDNSYNDFEDRVIAVDYFYEFPIIAARWDVNTGEVYGISPASIAKGSAISLQGQQKELGIAIQKSVRPPLIANATLKNQGMSNAAGSVTFVDMDDLKQGIQPIYNIESKFQELVNSIEDTRNNIKEATYYYLFKDITDERQRGVLTATEVRARQAEVFKQLGAIFESLQIELLNPVMDIVTSTLLRESAKSWKVKDGEVIDLPYLLPPPPPAFDEIKGYFKFDYINIIDEAQKASNLNKITEFNLKIQEIGQAKALAEQAGIMSVDFDDMINQVHESLNLKKSIMFSEEELEARKQEQQAAVEAQQQQEQMESMAGSLGGVAQGLNVKTGPDETIASDIKQGLTESEDEQA